MKKKIAILLSIFCLGLFLAACNNETPEGAANEAPNDTSNDTAAEESTITLAAAASLKNAMDEELIPMFNKEHPNINVQTTYDSSGKLQAQIEEGASIDVFMSAAMKQMDELNEKGLIEEGSIVELLENKIVLIVPANVDSEITSFDDILKADNIAIGDPESVPAGQYAQEALTSLGTWDDVSERASLGTNVTEVLNWVAEGSADVGIVYATDAASNENVKVAAEAPEGSVSKVIYPLGIIEASENKESGNKFVEFLETGKAIEVFESYGFTANK